MILRSLCVYRVSSREDRTPTQHARQLLRQDHTHHGGYVHCCHTFQSHREYCEFVFMLQYSSLSSLFVLLSVSVSTSVCLRRPLVVDQCLQKAGLVSRWTHANLKLIYIKCWNGAFDVFGVCTSHIYTSWVYVQHTILHFLFISCVIFSLHFTEYFNMLHVNRHAHTPTPVHAHTLTFKQTVSSSLSDTHTLSSPLSVILL